MRLYLPALYYHRYYTQSGEQEISIGCLERLAVNVGQLSWKPLKVDTEDPELKTTKMKISNLPLQRLKRV